MTTERVQPIALSEIARVLGGEVEGDGDLMVADVRSLTEAEADHLSFLSNPRFASQIGSSRAGAILVNRSAVVEDRTIVRCDDPYVGFARALALFYPNEMVDPGIDELAFVGEGASVEGARIDAFAWIGPGARIGASSWIQSGVHVGKDAAVGEGCRLMPNSVVGERCVLGDRVWLNPGAVVGGEGFGFAPSSPQHVKIPQTGVVIVEDDVEIGANSCVDRATMGATVIKQGTKIDNLVQIAHGVEVGEGSLLAAFVGIAGSSRLGRNVIMGGRGAVSNHVTVGEGVQVGGGSVIFSDQPAGARIAGYPAIKLRQWLRASTAFAKLPAILKRMRRLEKRMQELESNATESSEDPGSE
jgi:UDP-3-O-[3-hydroxymyristoyl] glucosamine N-acyltransferase